MSAAIPISSPGSTRTKQELTLCYDPESDLISEERGHGPCSTASKPSEALTRC